MFNKYKKRKKTFLSNSLVLFFLLIIISTVSIGYSLWSSELTIRGTVFFGENKNEDNLENIIQPGPAGEGDYATVTDTGGLLNITNQELVGNTLTIDTQKLDGKGSPRDLVLTFQLENSGRYNYINGSGSANTTPLGGFIQSNPTVTVPQTINRGETENVEIKFTGLKNNKLTQCTCTVTIQYEINEEIHEFFIVIKFA